MHLKHFNHKKDQWKDIQLQYIYLLKIDKK